MSNNNNSKIVRLLVAASATVLLAACVNQTTAIVGEPELPDYRVGQHRVDDPLDMYIQSQIPALMREVTPESSKRSYDPISVSAGPALERALVGVTRQHFSNVKRVASPQQRPTLSYALLAYKPVVTVEPGLFTTALNVSARIALEMTLSSSIGEELFSDTIIGTSHVSDKNIAPGNGLGEGARLLEVATRDAIIDAMYAVSRTLGSNSAFLSTSIRKGSGSTPVIIESIDGTVLHVQTHQEFDN